MPRSIWSGAISFGLVNVPVRMFSAVSEHKLHFNYVHVTDGSPIGYAKCCKAEDKPVDDSEIAKAFDWDGEYVILRDEDFERAQEDTFKTIDIKDFVERDRQHLGCLRVRDGALILERMHFADEVRDAADVAPESAPKLEKQELELARDLIGRLAGPFEPGKYTDTYRDALCEIIKERREGGAVEAARPEKPKQAPDLMEALRASLAARDGGGADARGDGNGDLSKLSKAELYERAKRADVPGRADMTKDELVEALSG